MSSSETKATTAVTRPGKRILLEILIAMLGLVAGSYVSTELLHRHYPDQTRESAVVFDHTIEAMASSPISMTIGVIPTIQFYGAHGILVIPGVLMAAAGAVMYYRSGSGIWLVVLFMGFVFWSHNNLLGFHALMSV